MYNGSSLEFVPSLQLPGLQYIEHVDDRSSASEAGLHPGDFILEVWIQLVIDLFLFYPHDAMLARVLAMAMCLPIYSLSIHPSLCHKSVF